MQCNKIQEDEIATLKSKLISLKTVQAPATNDDALMLKKPVVVECETQTDPLVGDDDDDQYPTLTGDYDEIDETEALRKAEDNLDLLHDSTVCVMNVREKILKLINEQTAAFPVSPNPPPKYDESGLLSGRISSLGMDAAALSPGAKTADTSIISSSSAVWEEQISFRDMGRCWR